MSWLFVLIACGGPEPVPADLPAIAVGRSEGVIKVWNQPERGRMAVGHCKRKPGTVLPGDRAVMLGDALYVHAKACGTEGWVWVDGTWIVRVEGVH